jgi:hypothetical protein
MVPLTEDFLFEAGEVTEGIDQPVLVEIAAVKLSHDGLNSRITLSGVNWSLHLASEIYLLLPKCTGGYSSLDDLPACWL